MRDGRETRVVVGALPPPIGGVSVFVQRQVLDWSRRGDLRVLHSGPSRLFRLAWLCLTERRAEFHVNTLHPVVLLLLFVTRTCPRSVIYDHNHSRHLRAAPLLARLTFYILRRSRNICLVNETLAQLYSKYDIPRRQLSLFSPFVAPDEDAYSQLFAALPGEARRLALDPNVCLVVNSAWKLLRDSSGQSVYGFEATARVAREVGRVRPDVHFLLFLGLAPNDAFSREVVADLRTIDNVTVVTGQYFMWPIFKHTRLFLRTTSTDGDSIAVREALHFSVPVLASDSVPRPVGTNLYKFGDDQDLLRRLLALLPEPLTAHLRQ